MIICLCHNVSDRDIAREAASGCRDFDALQEQTRVATACGACTDCARDTFNDCRSRGCASRPSAAVRPASATAPSFLAAVPA